MLCSKDIKETFGARTSAAQNNNIFTDIQNDLVQNIFPLRTPCKETMGQHPTFMFQHAWCPKYSYLMTLIQFPVIHCVLYTTLLSLSGYLFTFLSRSSLFP